MKIHRAVAATVGVGAVLLAGASGAAADPVNSKNSQIIVVHCDTLGDVPIVTFGNGKFTPGLVVSSTGVGIPYKLDTTFTFTTNDGQTFTDTEVDAHPAPRNGRLDVCTFHQEFTDENGNGVGDGTAWISYTPVKN